MSRSLTLVISTLTTSYIKFKSIPVCKGSICRVVIVRYNSLGYDPRNRGNKQNLKGDGSIRSIQPRFYEDAIDLRGHKILFENGIGLVGMKVCRGRRTWAVVRGLDGRLGGLRMISELKYRGHSLLRCSLT